MGALEQRRVALSMCEGGGSQSLFCARGMGCRDISSGTVRLIDGLRGAEHMTFLGLSEGALWAWGDSIQSSFELCSDCVARQIPLEVSDPDSDSADTIQCSFISSRFERLTSEYMSRATAKLHALGRLNI